MCFSEWWLECLRSALSASSQKKSLMERRDWQTRRSYSQTTRSYVCMYVCTYVCSPVAGESLSSKGVCTQERYSANSRSLFSSCCVAAESCTLVETSCCGYSEGEVVSNILSRRPLTSKIILPLIAFFFQ